MRFSLTDLTVVTPPIGTVLVIAAFYIGARRAATRALPIAARRRFLIGTAAFLTAWIVLATSFAFQGVFGDASRAKIPPVAFGLVLPMLAVLAVLAFSDVARRALAATPQPLLIGVQVSRVLGAVFLALLAQGHMPGAFALPAGSGDVAVGATAPVLAWSYRADSRAWSLAAVAWNVFGVIDLVVAVTTGVLTAPGHWQRLAVDAPNTAITSFPFVLIPIVLVPSALLLHAFSLHRLAAARHGVGATPCSLSSTRSASVR